MLDRAIMGLCVGLAVLGLAACTATPSPSTSPAGATPSATVAPSPATTFPTAQEAAVEAVMRFFEVENQVASNFDVPLDALYEVAAGDLVDQRLRVYQQYRAAEVRQVGSAVPQVRDVVEDAGAVTVIVCVDTSDLDMVDPSGKSVIAPESPTLVLHQLRVERVGEHLRAVGAEAVKSPC